MNEIVELRTLERAIDLGARELDRLAMKLLPWPRTIVLLAGMPPGSWADLPPGWQTQTQLHVTPQGGIPRWRGGAVAVAIDVAYVMIALLERGYRG